MSDGDARVWATRQGERIDVSDPVLVTSEEMARRRQRGGRHVWVLNVVHVITDPEQALDTMTLDSASLVGFSPIHCIGCGREYALSIREDPCTPAS